MFWRDEKSKSKSSLTKILTKKRKENFMTLHFLVNGQEDISNIKHKALLINHRKIYTDDNVFDSG